MELLADPSAWLAFVTLTALEIVLGIDNIVFISILTDRLPVEQRARARYLGLLLAMFLRIALLFTIAWMMNLTADLFTVLGNGISGRDLILLIGGAFLIAKATLEVHDSLEGGADGEAGAGAAVASFGSVLVQIGLIDLVFSIDSVITAVGLVDEIAIMVAAIVVAVLVMMAAARPISALIENHPSLKILALSFLMMVGLALVADGLGLHIPKGYIYTAMAFSVTVETLNIRMRQARERPVKLRKATWGDIVGARHPDGRAG